MNEITQMNTEEEKMLWSIGRAFPKCTNMD